MRVDFMVIGAQKSGTSSLARQLATHPEICFCQDKEPAYFNRVEDWMADLDGYHGLYSPQDGQICGEASTMYTFLPEWRETHARLHAYNPELRLIYIMRQPVERVISNFSHRLVRGYAEGTPEVAVFADPVYVNRTRYGVQLRPYLELFGRESLLLLIFEEYVADQAKTLREVAEFLGLSPERFPTDFTEVADHRTAEGFYLSPGFERLSVSKAAGVLRRYVPPSIRKAARRQLGRTLNEKPVFSTGLRRTLWRFLEDDVRAVEEMLGRRLDLWRQGYTD